MRACVIRERPAGRGGRRQRAYQVALSEARELVQMVLQPLRVLLGQPGEARELLGRLAYAVVHGAHSQRQQPVRELRAQYLGVVGGVEGER